MQSPSSESVSSVSSSARKKRKEPLLKDLSKFQSSKFENVSKKLGLIDTSQKEVDTEFLTYKLKPTKPAMAFYGSYSEMLQTMSLRGKKKKSKKEKTKERWGKNLHVHPAEFSFVETGQIIAEEDLDVNTLDLTPNS